MSIWDPESVSICGRTYTVIMPSARDTLNIEPRLQDVNKYHRKDGTIPDDKLGDLIDLFVLLVAIGVEECITGEVKPDRLPMAPLIKLGPAVLSKLNAAYDYAAEQKKTSNEAPTIEQPGR